MNYRHAYHAGNFADAFKHILLIALLQSFKHKETAFCYLETHAGTGSYDLFAAATQKSKEFTLGVAKIHQAKNPPLAINDYLNCIHKINNSNELRYYPGSPYFARQFLRQQDRMVLSELHPEEFAALKTLFARDKQAAVHHQDGYQSLKAFLPPKERRGLVLIDPPYEKNDELLQLPKQLNQTLTRWETGIYALWYPIKQRAVTERFYRELTAKIQRPMLTIEFCIYPDDVPVELNGCGMVIVNPPWQFDQQMKEIMPWLWKTLSINNQGHFSIRTF